MNKNNLSLKEYVNVFISDFADIDLLDGEIFMDLKTPLYPEIKPVYKISNKNRIYSTESNKFLSVKIKKSGNGYFQVNLQTSYKGCPYSIGKSYPMHRLMMAIFNPVDNMEKLHVNHKDGNKSNNDLTNLEWCTSSENTIHAIRTGLFVPPVGEDASGATISEKTARRICELIRSGNFSHNEIAQMTNSTKSIVQSIARGATWKHVSKEYNLNMREVNKAPKKFSVQDIHNVCKYFQDNKISECESVRKYIIRTAVSTGLLKGDLVDENLIYSLRLLYKRKSYDIITSKYKY